MANALFNPGREGFLLGEIDWDTAVIKVALVRGYTFLATDKFVSQMVATGTIHATSAALASKTGTNGTADAADLTFTTPAANGNGHSLVYFQSSAVTGGGDVAQAAQRLIAWVDTGTGLPVTPNGADISVVFNASGLFTL